MKAANRWLAGVGVLVLVAALFMALEYPEKSVALMVGCVMGFIMGMFVQNSLHKFSFTQGASMTQDLQTKVLSNPAAVMRETRLAQNQSNQSAPAAPQMEIPKINITGFNQT